MLRRQFCQAPGLTGPSSSAAIQLLPKSMERSTAETVRSPDQAWPRTSTSRAAPAPFSGDVTRDFTGMRSMISKSSVGTLSPGATE